MKYKEVIYAPILTAFTDLKAKIDVLLESHEDDKLTELFVKLDALEQEVSTAISEISNDRRLGNISASISEPDTAKELGLLFASEFRRLTVLLTISNVLEGDEDLDLDTEIEFPVQDFKVIVDIGRKVPFYAFGYFNSTNKNDSIGFLNFAGNWLAELLHSKFNHPLLACALYTLAQADDLTYEQPYIFVRADATNASSISATLRLQAVAHGIAIHSAISSKLTASLTAAEVISATRAYQQFDELILILSEFNSRDDILAKFISLYHVVESFMYKIPIAKLGENNGGKMFSIRDFKRLYNAVEKNEIIAIKDICKSFWNVAINGVTFGNLVKSSVRALSRFADFKRTEFDLILSKLGVADHNGFEQLQGVHAATYYASLIYQVRCAIVHNSETEYHISHYNLSPTLIHILDDLLMKTVEILIFNQIADHSSSVWYKGPSLHLYPV